MGHNDSAWFLPFTEQCDNRRLSCQPFLLAFCRHSNPGYYVHSLRPLHGTHSQDTRAPSRQVMCLTILSNIVCCTSLYKLSWRVRNALFPIVSVYVSVLCFFFFAVHLRNSLWIDITVKCLVINRSIFVFPANQWAPSARQCCLQCCLAPCCGSCSSSPCACALSSSCLTTAGCLSSMGKCPQPLRSGW